MIWRFSPWLVLAALVVVLLPVAASAKEVTKVLVVGANGRSANLGSGWSLLDDLRPESLAHPVSAPHGSYLLVYPLMEEGLPMEPGRYYPTTGVACWSWSSGIGDCFRIARLPRTWERIRSLTRFVSEQTRLRRLTHQGARYTVPSNYSVAIELALLRTQAVRRSPTSTCRWRMRARWQGPGAASEPTSLCLRGDGVSTRGRLYPIPHAVATVLHTVS
jgi:hypothetical protein